MSASPPSTKELLFSDLERELVFTRKVLERVPEKNLAWKPHEKSMSLSQLALHVAFLPDWIRVTLALDTLDFASAPRPPKDVKSQFELLDHFDKNVAALHKAVANFDVSKINAPWSMRDGQKVFVTKPRIFVYRIYCLNHLIHHRGQLNLYLRLLNTPVPTLYFNSADDPAWVFD